MIDDSVGNDEHAFNIGEIRAERIPDKRAQFSSHLP
jgi:hypothetical protein